MRSALHSAPRVHCTACELCLRMHMHAPHIHIHIHELTCRYADMQTCRVAPTRHPPGAGGAVRHAAWLDDRRAVVSRGASALGRDRRAGDRPAAAAGTSHLARVLCTSHTACPLQRAPRAHWCIGAYAVHARMHGFAHTCARTTGHQGGIDGQPHRGGEQHILGSVGALAQRVRRPARRGELRRAARGALPGGRARRARRRRVVQARLARAGAAS